MDNLSAFSFGPLKKQIVLNSRLEGMLNLVEIQ
jgi:hypothetical protein